MKIRLNITELKTIIIKGNLKFLDLEKKENINALRIQNQLLTAQTTDIHTAWLVRKTVCKIKIKIFETTLIY